jgi:hypothetical protein
MENFLAADIDDDIAEPEFINPESSNYEYSESELQFIDSVAEEAAELFPAGKQHLSPAALRDELRQFAHRKGFAVTTDGTSVCCSRFDETTAIKNKRARRNASSVVPPEKRRTYRSST